MYKKIFAILALAASLVGCNKELKDNVPAAEEGVKFTVTASFDDPSSKVSYTEEDGSLKAKFSGSDFIQVYFLKENGDVCLEKRLPVNPYTISEDGRKANFEITNLVIPNDATNIYVYLSNTGAAVTLNDTTVVDLSVQASFAEACKRQVLCGGIAVKDLVTTKAGEVTAGVKFAYLTNIVKFALTLPKDAGAKVGNSTVIKLSNANNTIHNKISVKRGSVLADKSEMGDIEIYPTAVEELEETSVAYAYACLLAGDNLAGSTITVTIGEERYACDLNFKKETLEAGKLYTAPRTLKILPKPFLKWTNNAAGEVAFKYSGGENLSADWLKCENGNISWTANTSGLPRVAKLTFANGAVAEVAQLEPADFKGNWGFTFKGFAVTSPLNVTFGDPLVTEELTDVDGVKHTNNIGIRGLYENTVLDAVVEIDYEAAKAKCGLFLDTRDDKGQACSKGFAVYFPGLCTVAADGNSWGKPWAYNTANQGTPDYSWLWFEVSQNLQTIMYQNSDMSKLQRLTQYSSATMNVICGFGVLTASTNNFAANPSKYTVFFQNNPLGYQAGDGEYFTRK